MSDVLRSIESYEDENVSHNISPGSSRKVNRDSQFNGHFSEERLNCVEVELASVR